VKSSPAPAKAWDWGLVLAGTGEVVSWRVAATTTHKQALVRLEPVKHNTGTRSPLIAADSPKPRWSASLVPVKK